jgi:hypothetical protein
MKRVITLIVGIFLVGASLESYSQCIPDTAQHVFLIPDTAADFSPAYTYMPYVQVLYIAVPLDTAIFGLPATFDSIVLVGVDGLPASITFEPSPANGVFQAEGKGCIQFSGMPTFAEIGTYDLTINTMITGTVSFIGDTTIAVQFLGYTIKVLDSASYGIHHPQERIDFSVYQNSPNPFGELTEIAFQSSGNENVSIQIFDILGHQVFAENVVSKIGYNSVFISGSTYKPGVYMYRVSNGKLTFSRRMLVSNR